jgi:acyl-coenzyme A thioesterase PaaI-like protein
VNTSDERAAVTGRSYPPERHVLRDLDFEVEVVAANRAVARFDPGGTRELGGLLTVVDLLAGTVCLATVAPDWMATSDMSFHLCGPLPEGHLVVDAALCRAGRAVVTVDVRVTTSAGADVGEGIVSFSRLSRPHTSGLTGLSSEPGSRFSFDPDDPSRMIGADRSLRTAVGIRELDGGGGGTETPLVDYVRNSFGAMNGGVVTAVIEAAALDRVGGSHETVTDVVVHFLSQGRTGPVVTVAQAVRSPVDDHGGWMVRVDVSDAGDDRLMAVAHVGVAKDPQA